MKPKKACLGDYVLAMFVALSLILAAFAHRVPAATTTQEAAAIAATLLPGETLENLCAGSPDGTSSAGERHCDFCTLSHAMAASGIQAPFLCLNRFEKHSTPITKTGPKISPFRPNAPAHAPPFFS